MSKRAWAGAVVTAMTMLSGCGGGFFIDTKTTIGAATSATGDYLYAVNPTTNGIYEYTLASGALVPISGSPVTAVTGLSAASIAISRANTYVYVGGLGTIGSYTIGSTGALSTLAAQAYSAASTDFTALDTSPDGQWLFAMDVLNANVYVFKINTSTGALGLVNTVAYRPGTGGSFTPRALRIAPTGNFLAVAMGSDGDALFTFNTSTGALAYSTTLSLGTGYSDNAVQFDNTGQYLFIARGNGTAGASLIATYTVNGNGTLTSGATLTPGNNPYALLLESSGSYLYAANRSDGTISGYLPAVAGGTLTSSSGAITAISGSPYATGTTGTNDSPVALIEDKSHAYIAAVGSAGGVDLTLYSLDAFTSGKLDPIATATSGAVGLAAIASTHGTGVVQ